MTLDKFQKAWKAEAAQVRLSFDEELLTQRLKESHSDFQSMIRGRDTREIGMALVMIPIWIVMGLAFSLPWTWYLSIPALAWTAIFMWFDRKRHPQTSADAGEPLSFYVEESLKQVEHQIWLLRNVFWWYLLPYSISIAAFFIQTGWDTTKSWWGTVIIAGVFGTFVFYMYRWIYRLNQKAVQEQLEPRRDKLQKLFDSLERGESADDVDDIMDLVPDSIHLHNHDDTKSNTADWPAWAANWNRIIPSWREVAIIMAPTILGGYCGWRFAVPSIGAVYLGPVFFQAVVAAVIPFEIAFFTLWYRSYKKHQGQPLPSETKSYPQAPAIFTLFMIIIMAILAFSALMAFSRGSSEHVKHFSRTGPAQLQWNLLKHDFR